MNRNPDIKLFATFDDKRSIGKKQNSSTGKIGGIMFWELSDDQPADGLVKEIGKRLLN